MKHWNSGDEIVLRYRRNQPADVVFPVRVIEDRPECLQVFLTEGTTYKGQATKDGRSLGREIPFLERERLIQGVCDKTWARNHSLMVQRPNVAYAVWLFWNASDWSFAGYYVNLQAPLERTTVGFDTADHLLDIVVAPDLTWEWKDEDEFAEARVAGILSPDVCEAALAASERAIADIDARNWPFDGSLVNWRPDPDWTIPVLPYNWNEGF